MTILFTGHVSFLRAAQAGGPFKLVRVYYHRENAFTVKLRGKIFHAVLKCAQADS